MGIVHFLEAFLSARYTDFNTASALGEDLNGAGKLLAIGVTEGEAPSVTDILGEIHLMTKMRLPG